VQCVGQCIELLDIEVLEQTIAEQFGSIADEFVLRDDVLQAGERLMLFEPCDRGGIECCSDVRGEAERF